MHSGGVLWGCVCMGFGAFHWEGRGMGSCNSLIFGVNFRGVRFHSPCFSLHLAYQIRGFHYAFSLVASVCIESSIHWNITRVSTFYQNSRQLFANQMSNSCFCLSATLFLLYGSSFIHLIIRKPHHYRLCIFFPLLIKGGGFLFWID